MKSSKFIYWCIKMFSMSSILLTITMLVAVTVERNISFKLLKTIFPGLMFLGIAICLFLIIDKKLTLVELNEDGIATESELIPWVEVRKISFTFIGLYRVNCKSEWFFLSPATPPRFVFAINLNMDEFNSFIEKKIKQFKY
jgi:hypothetical protein